MKEPPADLRAIEKRLVRRSYRDVDEALAPFDDGTLIQLFDSRSIRVGDTAASLLFRRRATDIVIDAVLSGRIRTRNGKIRAINILHWQGRKCLRAVELYLRLIHDRNHEVAGNALFGLVFLQDKRFVGEIRQAMLSLPEGSEHHTTFARAIAALEKENPFLYSPHFRDESNVWELDPVRFADRIR